MTDRPIIFSGHMVRALLDGRKTQTRRLATSPLRRCEVGDRLYVREAWRPDSRFEKVKPRHIFPGSPVEFMAGGVINIPQQTISFQGKSRPGMHMPRWASRLTLTVTDVRSQRLRDLGERDAEAEGCVWDSADGFDVWYVPGSGRDVRNAATATECYANLWQSLHTEPGQRWEDNPDVVALTFTVERRNIDGGAQ